MALPLATQILRETSKMTRDYVRSEDILFEVNMIFRIHIILFFKLSSFVYIYLNMNILIYTHSYCENASGLHASATVAYGWTAGEARCSMQLHSRMHTHAHTHSGARAHAHTLAYSGTQAHTQTHTYYASKDQISPRLSKAFSFNCVQLDARVKSLKPQSLNHRPHASQSFSRNLLKQLTVVAPVTQSYVLSKRLLSTTIV